MISALAVVAAGAVTVVLLELLLRWLLYRLRGSFQWLILDGVDEVPVIEAESLQRFLPYGYDPELGWVRKPNTSGQETGKSAGEAEAAHHRRTNFHLGHAGARLNAGHEHLPALISAYGDSYVFARQVDDHETWAWYLSDLTASNVLNFGVGNYGLDQALLRLKRQFSANPTPIVIMGVVPETLVRILSVWKHYVEYGNVLGAKPRFLLENGRLRLIPNVIDHPKKFETLPDYIEDLKRHDYWYTRKFRKDLLRAPYLLSVLRRPGRHIPLIGALLLRALSHRRLIPGQRWEGVPWRMILAQNFRLCREVYKDPEAVALLAAVVDDFTAFAKANGATPILCVLPYLHDVYHVRTGGAYYQEALEQLRAKLLVIDLGQELARVEDVEKLYVSDYFGSHLSADGNRVVAITVLGELKAAHVL